MNLFNLEESKVKTVRVLVYPNITFQRELSKDSYIQVIKQQITLLNTLRDDLWFYLILPCEVPSLNFPNVTQWFVKMPSYPPAMRSHFDVLNMQNILDYTNLDFDLVMSHLPEHTHALKNTMYNLTHHTPPIFGYCHWFDVKEVVTWPKDSFIQNIAGLLEYDRCYLNTQYQKDLVIKQARETFNDDIIDKLESILTVQYLGVNRDNIVSHIQENTEKIIVFNHRPDAYKNFNGFMKVCDELWKKRQDFKVWIPLLDQPNRDYVVTDKGDKDFYYKKLQSCCVGFSPEQKYGGWSVATTDGMMNGVPYIMFDASYYHELNDKGEFFKDDHDALMLMNIYLDDPKYRNEQANNALNHVYNKLIYSNEIIKMNDYINDLLSRQKVMGASDRLQDIVEFIKKGPATKKQIMEFLGWGRGIKWSPYRRSLMLHPNIFDIKDPFPVYTYIS